MAFSANETDSRMINGASRGGYKLYGNCTLGGVTSGEIIPGSNTTNVEGSSGLKVFTSWGFTNKSNSNAFKVVKSYDSTAGGDKLTITGTANDSFDWWIEGDYQGS